MTEADRPSPGSFNREALHRYFTEIGEKGVRDSVRFAYGKEAAEVAPEAFYHQAYRDISRFYLGSNGQGAPSPEMAMEAYHRLCYLWVKHDTEPQEVEPHVHAGIAAEGMMLATLAGARAENMPIAARCAPAYLDYGGKEIAADIELFTPNESQPLTNVQIKNGEPAIEDCKYDTDRVVVLWLPVLAQYLPEVPNHPAGKSAWRRLSPFRQQLKKVGRLPERRGSGLIDETEELEVIAASLQYMQVFGEAVAAYVHDRPDKAIIEMLRSEYNSQILAQHESDPISTPTEHPANL